MNAPALVFNVHEGDFALDVHATNAPAHGDGGCGFVGAPVVAMFGVDANCLRGGVGAFHSRRVGFDVLLFERLELL